MVTGDTGTNAQHSLETIPSRMCNSLTSILSKFSFSLAFRYVYTVFLRTRERRVMGLKHSCTFLVVLPVFRSQIFASNLKISLVKESPF